MSLTWTRKLSIQLNLAHVARNWNKQSSAHLIQYRLRSVKASVWMEKEWLWRKGFVKEMSFKSGVEGRGSDRWWERRWWL